MRLNSICILAFGAVLAACGGGGGTPVAGIDRGGTPAPAAIVSKGTITGFGSIVVNGVRYETGGAIFEVDGNPGTQADLRIGQVVVVRGTVADDNSTATATSVVFNDTVEGPISAIDKVAGTIGVLGQIVSIDADTSIDDSISPPSIEGLAVADIVEVSGFFVADGSIRATRIEAKPPGREFEVTGIVSNAGAGTFQINDLVVDYSNATQIRNFPGGVPEDGQLVEAKGNANGGGLAASEVEFKGTDLPGGAADRAEVEGFITDFTSASAFDVEGVPVTTSGSTTYVNGDASGLALNRKLEVEGSIGTNGILAATKIEFRQLSNFIRVEGLVDARSGSQLTILGIAIETNTLTRFEDKSSQDDENFEINDIVVGNYLELRGYEEGPDSNPRRVIATIVEREDFDGEIALRGIVESVSDPQFSILGVTIQTAAGTQFRNANGQSIPAADFFSNAEGRLVEAKGSESNGGIAATEVQFEN